MKIIQEKHPVTGRMLRFLADNDRDRKVIKSLMEVTEIKFDGEIYRPEDTDCECAFIVFVTYVGVPISSMREALSFFTRS